MHSPLVILAFTTALVLPGWLFPFNCAVDALGQEEQPGSSATGDRTKLPIPLSPFEG